MRLRDPKVLIGRPPKMVAVRSEEEDQAVRELLRVMRRGDTPLVIVYRTPNRRIGVLGRSGLFASIAHAEADMRQATVELLSRLFGKVKDRALRLA